MARASHVSVLEHAARGDSSQSCGHDNTDICRRPDLHHAQFRTGPAPNEILIWPGPE